MSSHLAIYVQAAHAHRIAALREAVRLSPLGAVELSDGLSVLDPQTAPVYFALANIVTAYDRLFEAVEAAQLAEVPS